MANFSILSINVYNIIDCRLALESLIKHRNELKKMVLNYPIICSFSNYRFVLQTSDEIDELIKKTEEGIKKIEEDIKKKEDKINGW